MVEVKFYNEIDEKQLKFAVIVARFRADLSLDSAKANGKSNCFNIITYG